MNIKDLLFLLSSNCGIGSIEDAAVLAENELKKYCETKRENLTVIGFLKGESDYTLMLDAHIDQIGMVVTNIDDNGFLTVAKSGGIDIRSLPSRRVIVHGKEKINAVFCSVPQHLSSDSKDFSDISEMKIDSALGKKAKDVISLGDYVTFSTKPFELLSNKVCGPSFDNRVGVACLIETAKRLKDKKLPFNVAFVLSDGEELGLRGTKTATYKVNPDEAIVLDVSFGDGIGISSEESGKLGNGGMIGFAPVLSRNISKKLVDTAKENNIPYQTEVMGRSTGTNADMVGISREGVKTCTLSIPLRNMHTDCEIACLTDMENVCELLVNYILSGGVMND